METSHDSSSSAQSTASTSTRTPTQPRASKVEVPPTTLPDEAQAQMGAAVRWQFGVASRTAPWQMLSCLYKALFKVGASWLEDENYVPQDGTDHDEANSGPHYKLPADPWNIKIRWAAENLGELSAPGLREHLAAHMSRESGDGVEVVAVRMELQIYEAEPGVYLIDFKLDGYETPDGKLLEHKDVTSPFPFLDMAARLIMQLAEEAGRK